MKTEISTDRDAAVELLRQGEVVALPTETVYGLAADAVNPIAVAKIFEAKGRPRFDPLIVHLPDRDWLEKVADLPTQDRQLVLKLAEKFWPGPFTMVLPKRDAVPEIVTAGLETVAVRISAHPVFAQIVETFGKPLAAPSANTWNRIDNRLTSRRQDRHPAARSDHVGKIVAVWNSRSRQFGGKDFGTRTASVTLCAKNAIADRG